MVKFIPERVANVNFKFFLNPFSSFSSISAIGLELWSTTEDIYFDNFLITDNERVGIDLALQIFKYRNLMESIYPVKKLV